MAKLIYINEMYLNSDEEDSEDENDRKREMLMPVPPLETTMEFLNRTEKHEFYEYAQRLDPKRAVFNALKS